MKYFYELQDWLYQTELYQEVLKELPEPLNNIYFDTIVAIIIGVYLLYRIFDMLHSFFYYRRIRKMQERERKEKKEQKENKPSNVSFNELTEEQKQARVNEEITEFSSQYPDVNVSELFENESFMNFAGEYLGKVPLTVAYGMYQKSASFKQAQDDAITKRATQLANSQASVGALSTAGQANDGYFTEEQVRKMSPAEIKKNYEKIRESQARW